MPIRWRRKDISTAESAETRAQDEGLRPEASAAAF